MFIRILLIGLIGSQACLAWPGSSKKRAEEKDDKIEVAIPACDKLLMRVDRIVDTYDVMVQHAVLNGSDRDDKSQWEIAGSARTSGYPGSWRGTAGVFDLSDEVSRAVYYLDGAKLEVAIRPGSHLISKVVPDSENTARIVGLFIHAEETDGGLDIYAVPFDVNSDVGQVVIVYELDAPKARASE